jgi:hypothetical protein
MSDRMDVPQGLCLVDVQRFKEAVWAVERENFRPGDALNAFDRAVVVVADAERARVVAEIRAMADDQDYATMCSWRSLAGRLAAGGQ